MERALSSALRRSPPERSKDVVAAYEKAEAADLRSSLLQVMGQAGTSQVLPVLRAATKDSNPDIVRGAILGLTDWPGEEPMNDLLALAGGEMPRVTAVVPNFDHARHLGSRLGPVLYHADPNALDLSRAAQAPGAGHPLGTDESGRDLLGRLLAGGRVSLAVGFAAVACSALLGLSLGGLAGLGGRALDSVIMRLSDAMMAIPALFLIITTLALFGTTVTGLVVAIGATSWMGLARLVRVELLAIREQNYVEAARALGARPVRVLLRHALPNAVLGATALLGTQFAFLLSGALTTEVIFAWPGLGRLLVTSVQVLDFPVVQAITLVVTVSVFLINTLTDLVQHRLDPRLRHRQSLAGERVA